MEFSVRVFLLSLALAASAHLTSGCGRQEKSNYPLLAKAHLDLCLNLLKSSPKSTSNFCVSPLSLSSALHTLSLGAVGETREDLTYALSGGLDIPSSLLGSSCDCYLSEVSGGGALSDVFNFDLSLLLKQNQKLGSGYLRNVKGRLSATVGFFEGVVNGLLNSVGGLLGKLLGNVNNLLGFVVKSVFNFDCGWKIPFDRRMIGPRNFYDINGRGRQGQFMHATGKFRRGVFDLCTVVELPFSEPGLSLFVFLPHEVDGLLDLQASLTASVMNDYLLDLDAAADLSLALPLLNLDLNLDLTAQLKNLGLRGVFNPVNADFSAMLQTSVSGASKLVHQTTLALSESGCSSSRSGYSHGSYRARGNLDVVIDRPFIFSFCKKIDVNVYSHINVGCVQSLD